MSTLKFNKVFNSFSVNNLEAAYKFYGNTLQLNVSKMPMNVLQLNIPGNEHGMIIYEKSNHEPASYTVLNFDVDEVEKTVDELAARGIVFEHYDSGPLKTDNKGICRGSGPVIAWFKDPAGNFLSILSEK